MAAAEATNRMKGRVAIVTGAGSRGDGIGNGRAAAVLLARHGARVALLDTEKAWVDKTLGMIKEEGGDAFVQLCDVTDPGQCEAAVAETVKRYGLLDTLVNNVGVGGPKGNAVEVDPDAWDRAMQVNVKSMMLMAKYAIPEMRKVGAGAIVNIASVAGMVGGNPNLLYSTSKGAVINMTRSMAAHHGREGIRVNCICPGMVYTPMVIAGGMNEARREARRKRSLLWTEGTGWDVGHAVLYLVSGEAKWITGVILPVDAGATAGYVASDAILGRG
jgi:NAD(P)-dependent dehydrogenase (short-subunit alcohol dehydrogenase family)